MVVSGFNLVYGIQLSPSLYAKVDNDFNVLYQQELTKFKNEHVNDPDYDEEDYTQEAFDESDVGKQLMRNYVCYEVEDKCCGDFNLVQVPHEARWTEYDGYDVYFGCVEHHSMDPCGKQYPFQQNFEKENAFVKFLRKLNISEVPEYHIIPDDCNCCS